MKRKRNIGQEAARKRNVVHEAPTSEEVQTPRHLRQLLAFDQDLGRARHGLQSFKELMDSIAHGTGEDVQAKAQIVTHYLEMTKPRETEDDDEVPVYLPDIMETWGMAAKMNNESVMSAVAVVLSLLLKLIANDVDLYPFGLGIGRTILQKRQQELLGRNLSADKGKDFIISPTLRLVREIICLDGGALAAPAFRARNYTFRSLARNMGLRFLGEGVEDPQRPSVRTNAVRLLLSSLKFLHVEAKRDLLYQKDIVAALMRELKEDPPYLILEILNTLRHAVVLDQKLSKDVKIRLLNAQSLIRIASLYTYHQDQSVEDGKQTVQEAAHEFLMAACTTSAAGILRPQHGYYPDGVDAETFTGSEFDQDLDIEDIPWMGKFHQEIPVRNALLAEFVQTLRPWSNLKQNELLIAIFDACPELVASYYMNKKSFSFDPKLSATWIGYSTLIFNTIRLDVPRFFGQHKRYARIPPPTSIILDNVLPLPLDTKTITRCLNQNSKMISFFAVRLLVISLEKLSTVLHMHRQAAKSAGALWKDAARRLVDAYCGRVPSVKDIAVNVYRTLSDGEHLQRVAVTRLLHLYHEVIPQVALTANFDFSPLLSTAIKRFEASDASPEIKSLQLMELENLSAIAEYSPAMKWFARGKESKNSPFVTLLRLFVENSGNGSTQKSAKILSFVAEEYELVLRQSQGSGFDSLINALKEQESIDAGVWDFLDNCAERCARSGIKYQEAIYEIVVKYSSGAEEPEGTPLSPLMMTMAEQLPFVASSAATEQSSLNNLASLLSNYLGHSRAAGVPDHFLREVLQRFIAGFGDSPAKKRLSLPEDKGTPGEVPVDGETGKRDEALAVHDTDYLDDGQLEALLHVPVKITKDNNALMKWTSKTAEEVVEEGYAASVVWLLASEHTSIRKEALVSIQKMATKVKESSYEENEQIWLLLMELAETARPIVDTAALPNTILSFACRALDVLKDPLHHLYPKVNTFLCRGPVWDVSKIPLVSKILEEGPSDEGAYYTELSWLLGYLLDGLRTAVEVELFRRHKVFEDIFCLMSNPYMGPNLRTQVLRILYRTTTIPGGSDTVITRFGVVSWLETQKVMVSEVEGAVFKALVRRLWATCDQPRIALWSRGTVKMLAERYTK